MKIIFEKCPNGDLDVYIHSKTATDQKDIDKKLFTHSEYSTKWNYMLDEWFKKQYFKHLVQEELIGSKETIIILTFINGRDDDFIKELAKYFYEEDSPYGHYIIEYKSFGDE
jgi:hypothetical protein